MPLNRPALTLGPGPRGVHEARQWVVTTCHDIGRPELVECAEIGVSELVTNAVLHGAPPVQVRVRGTVEHPHVEVIDSSREPPTLLGTDPLGDDDDFLRTFGRGLDIVGRCSEAWGAEIEDDGKVVWFAPAAEPNEEGPVQGVITGLTRSPDDRVSPGSLLAVQIQAMPLRAYLDFQVHYRELRREVRLLALAHEAEYPLAKTLSDVFGVLDRVLRDGIRSRELETAMAADAETADLRVTVPKAVAAAIGRFLELLDLADAFCRQEKLLSLARPPAQREFQQWFLGEFVRQQRGEAPLPCPQVPADGRKSVS